MIYYKCVRCDYTTYKKTDMEKHLKKTIKCKTIKFDILTKSDNEIYNISMIPKKDEIICKFCKKVFTRIDNLNIHIKKSCKKINCINTDIDTDTDTDIDKINNYIIGNNNIINVNIDNSINIENNVIINLVPFDEKWIVDHIDKDKKYDIMFDKNKYSNLLEEIMTNNNNLNIIIDKNSKYGIVYKNSNELYVNMKLKEIIDNSMLKLYDQLKDFFEENNIDENIQQNKEMTILHRREKYLMESKYTKYNKNNEIKNQVTEIFSDIFENKNKKSIEIAQNIINDKNIVKSNENKIKIKNGY
jgi:hypothetical protein